jgi:hypothetical protein
LVAHPLYENRLSGDTFFKNPDRPSKSAGLETPGLKEKGFICRAQAGLSALGHYASRIDGVLGGKTREALKNYSISKNTPFPVQIDEDLIQIISYTNY